MSDRNLRQAIAWPWGELSGSGENLPDPEFVLLTKGQKEHRIWQFVGSLLMTLKLLDEHPLREAWRELKEDSIFYSRKLAAATDSEFKALFDEGRELRRRMNSIIRDAGNATAGDSIRPVKMLHNWPEILAALELANDETNRNRVRDANSQFDGPIIFPGQGAQPKATKLALIVWYNGLEDRFREMAQRELDRKATVAVQHDYGSTATVVPDIAGEVKSRRKRKPKV